MRGTDGRLMALGKRGDAGRCNWGRINDGFEVTAPGRVRSDASPMEVMDGAGNVMEWVEDWYLRGVCCGGGTEPESPEYGTYKVLRGGIHEFRI